MDQQPSVYTVKTGGFTLIIKDETTGYGMFEHASGFRQWIAMDLMQEEP